MYVGNLITNSLKNLIIKLENKEVTLVAYIAYAKEYLKSLEEWFSEVYRVITIFKGQEIKTIIIDSKENVVLFPGNEFIVTLKEQINRLEREEINVDEYITDVKQCLKILENWLYEVYNLLVYYKSIECKKYEFKIEPSK